jgi:adenine specific DNA methylase Mod
MNQLYYGDNLLVLREHLADKSVDLIYLDPPFNSKRDYNLLFKAPKTVATVYDRCEKMFLIKIELKEYL